MSNATIAAPAPQLLLDPLRAAQALSISPRTLWGLTRSGEIPAIRLGRLIRYDPRDLTAYIDRRKAATVAVEARP